VSPTRFGDAVRSVRLYVPEGRLTADALRKIAALAVEAGSPQIRLLAAQDILLPLAHVSVLPKLYRHLTKLFGDIDLKAGASRGHKKTSRARKHPGRVTGDT
jgi:sulfite reductase beta subunit-like hemoprotein